MRQVFGLLAVVFVAASITPALSAQDAATRAPGVPPAHTDSNPGREYSGIYSFLKDGEFVQLTVEDNGQVTGFISRYSDGSGDKGAFLDHYFRTGRLEGNNLTF